MLRQLFSANQHLITVRFGVVHNQIMNLATDDQNYHTAVDQRFTNNTVINICYLIITINTLRVL